MCLLPQLSTLVIAVCLGEGLVYMPLESSASMSKYGKKPVAVPAVPAWKAPAPGRTGGGGNKVTAVSSPGHAGLSSGKQRSLPQKPPIVKPSFGQREAGGKPVRKMDCINEVENEQPVTAPILLRDVLFSVPEDHLPLAARVYEDTTCDIISLVRSTVKKSSLSNGFAGMLSAAEASKDRASLSLSVSAEKYVTHLTVSTAADHRNLAAGLQIALLSIVLEDDDLDFTVLRSLESTEASTISHASAWTSIQSACGDKLPFQDYFLYELVMDQPSASGHGQTSSDHSMIGGKDSAPSPGVGCNYDEDHIYKDLFGLLCSPLSSMAIGGGLDGMRYRRRFIVPHQTVLPSGSVLPPGSELVVAASDEALATMTSRKSKEDMQSVGSDDTFVPCWLLERPNPKLASYDSRRTVSFIAIPLYAPMTCMPSNTCHCVMLQHAQLVEFMRSRDNFTLSMHAFTYPLLQPARELKQLFPSDLAACRQDEVVERVVVQRHMSALCATEDELLHIPITADLKLLTLKQPSESLFRHACRYLAKLVSPDPTPSQTVFRASSVHSVRSKSRVAQSSPYALPIDAEFGVDRNVTIPPSSPRQCKSSPTSPTRLAKAVHSIHSDQDASNAVSGDENSSSLHVRKRSLSPLSRSPSPSTRSRSGTVDSNSYDMLSDIRDSGTFEPVDVGHAPPSPKSGSADAGPAATLRASFRNPSRFVPWQRNQKGRNTTTSRWFASVLGSSEKSDTDPSTSAETCSNLSNSEDKATTRLGSVSGVESEQVTVALSAAEDNTEQADDVGNAPDPEFAPRSKSFGGSALAVRKWKPAQGSKQAQDSSSHVEDTVLMSKAQGTPVSYQGKPPPPNPPPRQRKRATTQSTCSLSTAITLGVQSGKSSAEDDQHLSTASSGTSKQMLVGKHVIPSVASGSPACSVAGAACGNSSSDSGRRLSSDNVFHPSAIAGSALKFPKLAAVNDTSTVIANAMHSTSSSSIVQSGSPMESERDLKPGTDPPRPMPRKKPSPPARKPPAIPKKSLGADTVGESAAGDQLPGGAEPVLSRDSQTHNTATSPHPRRTSTATECLQGFLASVRPPPSQPPKERAGQESDVTLTSFDAFVSPLHSDPDQLDT